MRVTFLARRRALVITTVCGLAAAAVVATAALSSASPAGSAAVSTTFTVDLGKRGGAISDWGFDIKQASATKKVGASQAYADQLFKNKKFTVLRIPMHTERGWVNADGTVRRIQYNNHAGDSNYVIDAIRKALTANPDLKLYANRMSIEGDEWVGHWYDGALKTNGRLSMSKYATFLADYVRFINSVADDFTTSSGQPARVRILGPDNEPKRKANEGDLTPVRFANLAAGVKSRLGTRTPQLIMNDDATADVDWLATAQRQFNPDAWQPLSYAGMHYQSLLRDVGSVREPFVQFSRRARLDSVNGSKIGRAHV